MNNFYLNECLANSPCSCDELSAALVKAISAFARLANKKKLHIAKGLITEKEPTNMYFGKLPLKSIVDGMRSKECKRLFYVYCINYPIHKYFTKVDDDSLLKAEYKLGDEDAINVAIAAQNNGFLLSLPVSEPLKRNVVIITSELEEYKSLEVPNLHGDTEDNIQTIERELLDRNYKVLDGLERIECLAPEVIFSCTFSDRFSQLTKNDRQSILDRLDEAKNGKLLQPLRCNGTVIKHVSTHVAELRIVNPVDIRVYFHEQGNTLYFAKLEFKSSYVGKNDQNDDIEHAERIMIELIKK